LISKDSVEEEFARKRQLFLIEQGYSYEIIEASDFVPEKKEFSQVLLENII